MTRKEAYIPQTTDHIELPAPLPIEVQPSRCELTPYLPVRKLYLRPNLPHHGVLHGEEVMIWTAVILNQVKEDIRARRGDRAARVFVDKIDTKPLLFAASYHDCARMSDWPMWGNSWEAWPNDPLMRLYYRPRGITPWESENKKHGPRGADIITQPRQLKEIDPTLTPEQIVTFGNIIRKHTSNLKDGVLRMTEKGELRMGLLHPENYDPQLLMLRLMQEADALALVRTWYSQPTYGKFFNPHIAKIRERKVQGADSTNIQRRFVFPTTHTLLPLAHAHYFMNRLDPQMRELFPGRDRSGVSLETAERLRIIKP